MADPKPAAPPKPAPSTPRPPSGPGKTNALERVEARVAAAVAEAPPLPEDVRLRVRELVVSARIPESAAAEYVARQLRTRRAAA